MAQGLDLGHELLDRQLVDRNREHAGRCDTLTLELRDGKPPRVAAILVGGQVRDERIGRWMTALTNLFLGRSRKRHPGVTRIPFSAVRSIGTTIQVDVLRDNLESEHVEHWLARHVISRIPGGKAKGQ